jgi:hypothetical protein
MIMRCSHKFTYSPLAIHRHTDHLEHLDDVLFAALGLLIRKGYGIPMPSWL